MSRRFALVLPLILLTLAANASRLQGAAADNSANAAYAADAGGAWKGLNPTADENPPGSDNGGNGFLPWDFVGGYHQPDVSPYGNLNHFIDGVDVAHSTYNNLGPTAFGLTTAYAPFFGTYASARRPFSQPLAVGETFSASIDTPSVYDDYSGSSYPFAIITFQDDAGEETLKFETGSSSVYGDFPWRYTDASANNADVGLAVGGSSIAPTDTSSGATVSLKITSASGGEWTIRGVTIPVTFAHGVPKAVTFALSDNGSGDNYESLSGAANGQREFFFDDLSISSGGGNPIPGDFDGDRTVDGDDLAQWVGDFGVNGDSDANNDDVSDGADLLVWQQHLGESGGLPVASSIPEPTGVLLIGVALAATLHRRRRRGAFSPSARR